MILQIKDPTGDTLYVCDYNENGYLAFSRLNDDPRFCIFPKNLVNPEIKLDAIKESPWGFFFLQKPTGNFLKHPNKIMKTARHLLKQPTAVFSTQVFARKWFELFGEECHILHTLDD